MNIVFQTYGTPFHDDFELWAELPEGRLVVRFTEHEYEIDTQITFFQEEPAARVFSTDSTAEWPDVARVFPREFWIRDNKPGKGVGTNPHPQLLAAHEEFKAEVERIKREDLGQALYEEENED